MTLKSPDHSPPSWGKFASELAQLIILAVIEEIPHDIDSFAKAMNRLQKLASLNHFWKAQVKNFIDFKFKHPVHMQLRKNVNTLPASDLLRIVTNILTDSSLPQTRFLLEFDKIQTLTIKDKLYNLVVKRFRNTFILIRDYPKENPYEVLSVIETLDSDLFEKHILQPIHIFIFKHFFGHQFTINIFLPFLTNNKQKFIENPQVLNLLVLNLRVIKNTVLAKTHDLAKKHKVKFSSPILGSELEKVLHMVLDKIIKLPVNTYRIDIRDVKLAYLKAIEKTVDSGSDYGSEPESPMAEMISITLPPPPLNTELISNSFDKLLEPFARFMSFKNPT